MSEPLEARLRAVEKDLADLKSIVRRANTSRPWYERTIGSMKDYPEFDEVIRIGRELGRGKMETSDSAE